MFLVRPARQGLLIPMTTGGDLPATGAVISDVDGYWRRREADGDAIITEVQAETVEAAVAEIEGHKAPSKPEKKG